MSQEYVDALLIERAGYVRAGKTDRVAQVDAQLKVYGYEPPRAAADEQPATSRGRRTAKG